MNWSLNFADILTVAAIIIRAIAAVQVERARERRNQKFEFLKTLMRTRGDPYKGKVPHAYFNWTEGNPLLYLLHYVLSGEGDVAPVTREVLRKAEPNAQRRPAIHAGI